MDFISMKYHPIIEGIQVAFILSLLLILLPILIYRFNKGRTDDTSRTFRRKEKK